MTLLEGFVNGSDVGGTDIVGGCDDVGGYGDGDAFQADTKACDLCTVPFRKTDPRARDIPYIYICISLHTLAPTLTYVDGDLQVGLVD